MTDYTKGHHAVLGAHPDIKSRGRYIRLHSGRKFHLGDPLPEDVFVEDVAHNLAGIIRYTGSSRYSVAQHCVLAARMADKYYYTEKNTDGVGSVLAARMLIHDTAEAYYGDVSSPLKSLLPDYKKLEDVADACMEARFGLKFNGEEYVKEIDDRMWLTESRQFFGVVAYQDYPAKGPLKSFPLHIERWTAEQSETAWLDEFHARFSRRLW